MMTRTLPLLRAPDGLGSRVAVLANGLSRHAEAAFAWEVNDHCPLEWTDVFPDGIEGIRFREARPGTSIVVGWAGVPGYRWDAAADRGRADAAYGRIMAAMAGEARAFPPALAVCGRFFRNPECLPGPLANAAIERACLLGISRVFVFCDRHRAEIAERIEAAGLCAVLPRAPELRADLERDAAGMLEYLSDWKTLLAAAEIIACNGPASALHPARAAGTTITYLTES